PLPLQGPEGSLRGRKRAGDHLWSWCRYLRPYRPLRAHRAAACRSPPRRNAACFLAVTSSVTMGLASTGGPNVSFPRHELQSLAAHRGTATRIADSVISLSRVTSFQFRHNSV